MNGRMLYIHALSSVHSGIGQAVGVIDLPVARESVTNWPYLPGSTIKGVLRDVCKPDTDEATFIAAFGNEPGNDASAGALWISDARLLCLPVPSLYGTFAWVTCPLAIQRWQRDASHAGLPVNGHVPEATDRTAIVPDHDHSEIVNGGNLFLRDLDLAVKSESGVSDLAETIAESVFEDSGWQETFRRRFVIVSNDVFSFLAESGTEITARIKLEDETKTVQQGALWYEESVPAETIFSLPVVAAPRSNQPDASTLLGVLESALKTPQQIGGNASVGSGLVQFNLSEASA